MRKLVFVLIVLMVIAPGSVAGTLPAGASSSPLQQWATKYGPHLRAEVADVVAITGDTSQTTEAQLNSQCRTVLIDAKFFNKAPKIPSDDLETSLRRITRGMIAGAQECQQGIQQASTMLVGKGGKALGTQSTAIEKLLKSFKASGAPLNNGRTIHAPGAVTTTTTLPAAHVGDTLSTTTISVQLQQVIDPASSDNEFETPDPGKRYVGLKVQISDPGTSDIPSQDANNEFSIVGSDGQIYTPSFNTLSECTNFNDGDYGLTPKGSAVGCVAFQIPTGVMVTKVDFADSDSRAEWDVP